MVGLIYCKGIDMRVCTYGQLYGTMIVTETYNFSVLETGTTSLWNGPYQKKAQQGKEQSCEKGEEFGLPAVWGLGYTGVVKVRARYAV